MSAKPSCDLLEVRFNARALIIVLNWLKDVCPEMTLEATVDKKIAGTAILPGNIGMVEIEADHTSVIRWIKSPSESHAFFFALNLAEVVKSSPSGRANEVVLSTRKNSDRAQFRYYDPRGSCFLTSNVRWMDYGEPFGFNVEPLIAMSATFAMSDLSAASSTFTRVNKDNIVFDMEKKPDPNNPDKEVYDTNIILLRSDDGDLTFRFEIKQKEARTQSKATLKTSNKKRTKQASGWDDSDLDDDSDSDQEEEQDGDMADMPVNTKRCKKGTIVREINQLTDVTFDIEVFTRAIKKNGFAFRSKFFHDLLRISGVQEVQVQLFQRPDIDAYCMCLICPVPGFGTVKSYLMAVYVDM